MVENRKVYGHYLVVEEWQENGLWGGFRCQVLDSVGKQGKLYLQSDGRENYSAAEKEPEVKKGSSEDLEL